jgi:hypothetical protein
MSASAPNPAFEAPVRKAAQAPQLHVGPLYDSRCVVIVDVSYAKGNFMKKNFVALASFVLFSLPVLGQQSPVEGISFKLGDNVQAVKNALKTDLDPEPMENTAPPGYSNANAGKTVLFLRTKGIRVFFDKAGVAQTIRFDAPFAGSINGIKLGDMEKKVRDLKGKPIKSPWQFGAAQAFLYVLDDTAYIRFDISENDGVQTIFIQK